MTRVVLAPPTYEHFELTPSERASGLWLRLHDHLAQRLAICRAQNDRIQPEDETAALRGEIRALKRIIALGDERPVID